MGANANTMMGSFNETCDSVKLVSPVTSWLQTNTIAVHGATASRIRPAMYRWRPEGRPRARRHGG